MIKKGTNNINKIVINNINDDAASYILGGDWRMPTIEEWKELYNLATKVTDFIEAVEVDGHFCQKITADNGNFILLPLSGYYNKNYGFNYANEQGYYWLSSIHNLQYEGIKYDAYSVNFNRWGYYSGQSLTYNYRGDLLTIRPVSKTQGVDLGLSVKWADKNLGAEKPSDFGQYFAWGETFPKTNADSYKFNPSGDGRTFTKYNQDDNLTTLEINGENLVYRVYKGEDVVYKPNIFRGTATPNTTFNITINDTARSVTSNANGNWSYVTSEEVNQISITQGAIIAVFSLVELNIKNTSDISGVRISLTDAINILRALQPVTTTQTITFSAYTATLINESTEALNLAFEAVRKGWNIVGSGLIQTDDVAYFNDAETRMPTRADFEELIANTTNEWVTDYQGSGVNGRLFTASNGNSIFFPATGYHTGTSMYDVGSYGFYWSSTYNSFNYSYSFYFSSSNMNPKGNNSRYRGHSVRPVSLTQGIDLDLPSGLKWLDRNIGANSPADKGDYYAWGELLPKTNYSWSTYKFNPSGDGTTMTKYNSTDGLTTLQIRY